MQNQQIALLSIILVALTVSGYFILRPSNPDATHSQYRAARLVAWLLRGIGVLLIALALIINFILYQHGFGTILEDGVNLEIAALYRTSIPFITAGSLLIMIMPGVLLIALGEMMRSQLDTADNTRKILSRLHHQLVQADEEIHKTSSH